MAKPRKKFSQLTKAYKLRLRRVGIHPNTYNAGKVPKDLRDAARGHNTPLYRQVVYNEPIQPAPPIVEHIQYLPTPGLHSDEVKQALAERMYRSFGQQRRFRGALDPDFPPLDYPPAPPDEEIMEILELGDDDLVELAREASLGYQPQYWFLFYH